MFGKISHDVGCNRVFSGGGGGRMTAPRHYAPVQQYIAKAFFTRIVSLFVRLDARVVLHL